MCMGILHAVSPCIAIAQWGNPLTTPTATAAGGGRLLITDFDIDGDQDLISVGGGVLQVLTNDGQGVLSALAPVVHAGGAHAALLDVDLDGYLDVISAQPQSFDLTLSRNGPGGFQSGTTIPLSLFLPAGSNAAIAAMVVAEITGDGLADLVFVPDDPQIPVFAFPGGGASCLSSPCPRVRSAA